MTRGERIAIRALNWTQRFHPITYLGLRYLLASDFLHVYFALKAARTKPYPRLGRAYISHWLKGFPPGPRSKPKFRDWPTPTPLMALRGAYLAAAERPGPYNADLKRRSVYSNHLANPKGWHSFSYFFPLYQERNNYISRLLKRKKRAYLLMTDLKNFYPSIPRSLVPTLSPRSQKVFNELAAFFPGRSPRKGLPVGSVSSHMLANEFLSGFDRIMTSAFPGRFFRYVDDIAIVTTDRDPLHPIELVMGEIDTLGLQLHAGKTTRVTRSQWFRMGPPHLERASAGLDFFEYKNALQKFVLDYPKYAETLSHSLASNDIFIPLKQLQSPIRTAKKRRGSGPRPPTELIQSLVVEGGAFGADISMHSTPPLEGRRLVSAMTPHGSGTFPICGALS